MPITSNFFVSVLTVLSNDADILEPFFRETISTLKSQFKNYEFVLVDDGSHDETPIIMDELLKQYEGSRYVRLSRKFGIEEAISAGLDMVIGDVVVILDPQCDPPELILKMVNQVRQTNGIVFGVKVGNSFEPLLYRLGKKLFYKILSPVVKLLPSENATFFIGMTRQSLNAIIQIKNTSKFIRIFGGYVGFRKQILEYKLKLRRQKLRQKGILEGINYAVGIIVNNTTQPLRIIAYLGFFAGVLNMLYLCYIILAAVTKQRAVEGWMSSSFQISLMFLFVFVIFAVLSEYISILFDEVKQKPYYFVEEEKNSSVMFPDQSRKNIISGI